VKDSRVAEIAWMTVIAVLVAAGGNVLLALLAAQRIFGAVLLAALVVAAFLGLRRAFIVNAPSARIDVTKAAAYLVAAALAFVAIALHQRWAIGACIVAAEAAIAFDIVTIAARGKVGNGDGASAERS
jgi:hypothetical protein